MTTENSLHNQYELYPYPPRDPRAETSRLLTGSPSHIAEINHYIFAGKRDFTKPFRALIAGGGTGDGAIMLAQQLADISDKGDVVYLDLSASATNIAKSRAKVRGLKNIKFLQGSLLDVAKLCEPPFDYIDCCGVLHHLDDPSEGLESLTNVLCDNGGMGLMVYAPLGRTGVYPMQNLLRIIGDNKSPAGRLEQAKSILRFLPPTNWLHRNDLIKDHVDAGDAGIFDLLLHSQDRSYSVPELDHLIEQSRLKIVSFIEPIRYDPLAFLDDPELMRTIGKLAWIDQCAIAEQLTGNLKTHVVYVVKSTNKQNTVATPNDGSLIPYLVGLDRGIETANLREKGNLSINLDGLKISAPLSTRDGDLLALIDGIRSIDSILEDATKINTSTAREEFKHQFSRLFSLLNGLNLAFLKS